MRRLLILLVLALLWGQQKGCAQQVGWEYALPFSATPYAAYDVFGYLHQLAGGDYVMSGIGDRVSGGATPSSMPA